MVKRVQLGRTQRVAEDEPRVGIIWEYPGALLPTWGEKEAGTKGYLEP